MTVAVSRPGRQRSQAADDAILSAALELLEENGYQALTVASVIERAGVSSATLYRRFATKDDLVVAVLESLAPDPVEVDTGSLAGDLTAYVRHKADALSRKKDLADLSTECQRNPELADILREKFMLPSQAQLAGILLRAKHRGELRSAPSAEVAYSLLVGPLHYRAIVLREALTDAFQRRVVRHALGGLSAS
jgi:AcrR family transcriptional regulator